MYGIHLPKKNHLNLTKYGDTWVLRSEHSIDVNDFFIAYPFQTQLPELVSYHVFGRPCGHT